MDIINFSGTGRLSAGVNEWGTPIKPGQRVDSVRRTYFGCAATCWYTRSSHSGRQKCFEYMFETFLRGIALENVWERVRTFAKRVQRSQNVNESYADRVERVTTCDRILPHPGHTLMPHVYVWLRHERVRPPVCPSARNPVCYVLIRGIPFIFGTDTIHEIVISCALFLGKMVKFQSHSGRSYCKCWPLTLMWCHGY